MNKKILLAGIAALAVIGMAAGAVVYMSWFGEPPAPSRPMESRSAASAPASATAPPGVPSTAADPRLADAPPPASAPAVAPVASVAPAPAVSVAASAPRAFRLAPEASQASFVIFEELRGQPKNVLGTTNQVAGEVSVDLANLATARVGTIQVNARTFATDDERRNRALKNRILETEAHEFITFVPEQIAGLSGRAELNKVYPFTMTGPLTIRGMTRPATWEGGVMALNESELRIEARTNVKRSDYQITVPNLPFIANVADEVALEFKGAARAAAPSLN